MYKAIERDGCKLVDVTPQIRSMWIDQRFWLSPHEATPATYRNRAARMLEQTMTGTTLALSARQLSLGGNVDADIAREICAKHGCRLVVHRRARGGAELDTVKAQRNGLAHGDKFTFVFGCHDSLLTVLARTRSRP